MPRELIETLGDIVQFMARAPREVLSLKVLRFAGETLRQTGILILRSAAVIWGLAFILRPPNGSEEMLPST